MIILLWYYPDMTLVRNPIHQPNFFTMVKHRIISTLSINGSRGFLTSSQQCVELIQ